MKPTIGRIVHFTDEFQVTRPAVITAVFTQNEDLYGRIPEHVVALAVIFTDGIAFKSAVPFSEEPSVFCWNWPKREDA